MGVVGQWLVDHWEFTVGTALGILGIVVGIAVALWQRQPKTLDYEVRNRLPLLSPHAQAASQRLAAPLTLMYGNEAIENPYLLTVRIKNTGKRAISADDYAEAIFI